MRIWTTGSEGCFWYDRPSDSPYNVLENDFGIIGYAHTKFASYVLHLSCGVPEDSCIGIILFLLLCISRLYNVIVNPDKKVSSCLMGMPLTHDSILRLDSIREVRTIIITPLQLAPAYVPATMASLISHKLITTYIFDWELTFRTHSEHTFKRNLRSCDFGLLSSHKLITRHFLIKNWRFVCTLNTFSKLNR